MTKESITYSDISTAQSLQPNKYNGKELDLMHGLNTYDYSARQYDPITITWNGVDPLAEKNTDTSPFSFCHNNPVNRIDPDGRDDYEIDKDGYISNSTSLLDKVKALFGYGRNDDRIFMKGNDKAVLNFPEGTITNVENNKGYSKFEIKDAKSAEKAFKKIMSQSNVEWAHVRHTDKEGVESSLIINNHSDIDVSKSAQYARKYVNKGERISLFEHSHPLEKIYKQNGMPNLSPHYPPSKADVNTAGNYPNTQFKVYDVHNKNVYEYDKKGIKSISNW